MMVRLTGTTGTYSAAQPSLPPPILHLAHEVQVLVNLEVANVGKDCRTLYLKYLQLQLIVMHRLIGE